MLSIAGAFALLMAASLAGLALGRFRVVHRAVFAATLAACLILLGSACTHLWTGGTVLATLPIGLPWLPFHVRLDNLSALFMVVVDLAAGTASLFALSYGVTDPNRRRISPAFPLFVLGLNAVLLAADIYGFLVAWEFMSLSSWVLVVSDHASDKSRRAGLIYLIVAAFGTACLLASFAIMAGSAGGLTFAALRTHPPAGVAATLAVGLAILGAGSKAGLVPLHAWLPLAHPQAPAPASALMSGVMTKVAFYALIRILFDLMGGVAWEWGPVLLGIGAVTAMMGVLYALLQDDVKTLLAYSTVENVGIVAIALGLAVTFRADHRAGLAALALVAALYHMLNHSLAKSLMFLGTGTVIRATGHHGLERLGGLLNRLPWTGAAMLVGAAAMAALPPLNGFVSEWLIFQLLFAGPASPHWAVRFGVPVAGAALALAAALAAACFVRAYGLAFLGRPRSPEATNAVEAPWPMRIAVILLAVGCVVLGVIPVTVTRILATLLRPVTGAGFDVSAGIGWPFLSPVAAGGGSYSGTVLVLAGLALFGLAILVIHRLGSVATRTDPAWDCGFREDGLDPAYSPAGFAQPLRRTLAASLFRVRETVTMPEPGDMAPATHRLEMVDPVWRGFYAPLIRAVDWLADRVNRLHFLTLRHYLLMMFATLVSLLLVVAIRQ